MVQLRLHLRIHLEVHVKMDFETYQSGHSMQKDSQTIQNCSTSYFIVFSMFIVTLYSYQNSTTFHLGEIWVLDPPLRRCPSS